MSHPLGLLFFCATIVFAVVFLLWNFVPSWRDRMKGYSTLVEGGIMVVVGVLANLTGALQDAQAAGYMPPGLTDYVPIVFVAYFVLKRFVTTTPPGKRL